MIKAEDNFDNFKKIIRHDSHCDVTTSYCCCLSATSDWLHPVVSVRDSLQNGSDWPSRSCDSQRHEGEVTLLHVLREAQQCRSQKLLRRIRWVSKCGGLAPPCWPSHSKQHSRLTLALVVDLPRGDDLVEDGGERLVLADDARWDERRHDELPLADVGFHGDPVCVWRKGGRGAESGGRRVKITERHGDGGTRRTTDDTGGWRCDWIHLFWSGGGG